MIFSKYKVFKYSENKTIELEFYINKPYIDKNFIFDLNIATDINPFLFLFVFFQDLFSFEFNWSKNCNHPGLMIRFTILYINACYHFYDNRHYEEIEKDRKIEEFIKKNLK